MEKEGASDRRSGGFRPRRFSPGSAAFPQQNAAPGGGICLPPAGSSRRTVNGRRHHEKPDGLREADPGIVVLKKR